METREARMIAAVIDQRYPQATDLGIYNCRPIRGDYAQSDDWSQHAWGNAVDRGHPDPNVLRDMYEWAQQMQRRGTLPIGRHDGAILIYPGESIHIEGPQRTGVPPCAGGSSDGGSSDGDSPDVLNPPTEGGTAKVPVGPTPPGMEDRDASAGPLDRITSALDAIDSALNTATSRTVWLSVLQAVGGLVLIVVGVVIVGKEVAGGVL